MVLDTYDSNYQGFYLGLNLGYRGEMDAQYKDPATALTTSYKLTLDGVPSQESTDGATWTTIEVANGVITFTGGSLDGWRGRLGADSKPFIAIAGENHREVTDRTGNGWNDFKCYVQKD